ncbi:HNH endonuclease [Streptomyces sp. NPDC048278]|uniref:HNH endonuclease n=1 Tax=Streptomyces sp. NPDC048278 TaxID=3155809 RepID=UPI0034138BBA
MSCGVRYTRERLEEAARLCSSIDAVIAHFGSDPYAKLDRYLRKRFAHFGIDISHFLDSGRQPRPGADELRAAVTGSVSISGVLRLLRRPDTSTQRTLLRHWITEEGLSTAHLLGQAHSRGKSRPDKVKRPEDILVKHDGSRRTRTVLLRRALRDIGVPTVCAECGVGSEWLGRPMTLEVDHINGDWIDDRQENLQLLCPNCHAVTSTWCRGGSRRKA